VKEVGCVRWRCEVDGQVKEMPCRVWRSVMAMSEDGVRCKINERVE
jgi:hypothetical protein